MGKVVENQYSYDADIVVIGGGPGGYTAAIRGAQLGARVILIEKDQLGGTCLNRGCIPTKTLVKNASLWRSIKEEAPRMGITIEKAEFNWGKIIQRKDTVVSRLIKGIESLLKKNEIEVIRGEGVIKDRERVAITLSDGVQREIRSRSIIVATGTVPAQIPLEKEGDSEILSTDDILDLRELPDSLIVIGGGVIGTELASIFNTFGVKVNIVEMMPSLLPLVDKEVVGVLRDEFVRRGIGIYAGLKVQKVVRQSNRHRVLLSDGKWIEGEKVLMAVGRTPDKSVWAGLPLEVDKWGYLKVNERMQTSYGNILAVGDITGQIQLAHVAMAQGEVAVENLFGQQRAMEYEVIPNCIFTHPEIASVGITEEEALSGNIPVKVSKFPFAASGKAVALGYTRGFIKIIAASRQNEILGVHIIGPEAVNLIAEGALAMKIGATTQDIAETIHAHPTLSESVMEAAAGILGKGIH